MTTNEHEFMREDVEMCIAAAHDYEARADRTREWGDRERQYEFERLAKKIEAHCEILTSERLRIIAELMDSTAIEPTVSAQNEIERIIMNKERE